MTNRQIGKSADQILGVVVMYNTKFETAETLTSLAKSLEQTSAAIDLVVYDNSLLAQAEHGSIFSSGNFRMHYFHDPSNPGLGKAYNFAAAYAQKLKKRWILLLDQDTSFPLEAIPGYLSAIQDFPEIKLFAPRLILSNGSMLSPCRYRLKRGFALKKIDPGLHNLKNISPLNSGMLIDLDAYLTSGGYNEKVKLDFSDFQFIERFKKHLNQFCLLNFIALQDFSNAETDTKKLNARFVYYCDGAKNCEWTSFVDRFTYTLVVFLRATMLVWRTKEFIFYKTFMYNYLRAS